MTDVSPFAGLRAHIAAQQPVRPVGRVIRADAGVLHISGLADAASIGSELKVYRKRGATLRGEVVQITGDTLVMLCEEPPDGIALNDRAVQLSPAEIAPTDAWLGRMIDPSGAPIDGKPLLRGAIARPLQTSPPKAAERRSFCLLYTSDAADE